MRRGLQVGTVALLVTVAGCATIADSPADQTWEGFEDVTAESGFEYEARASGVGNGNSGVYVTDFDNDGWPDVLAIGGDRPVLFENSGGEFERSGALPQLNLTVQGALFFDADADGLEDLLILPRNGEAVFLENTGDEFERAENGLGVEMDVAVGASAADYDGDGDLDVFVIQYGDWAETTPKGYLHPEGDYIADDNGARNLLFENTEDGFKNVTGSAGISGTHWSLATSFVDLTGNGDSDIHVANDFNNDTLYVNRGDGTFERTVMGGETNLNGMSSEVGDFNGDGRPDLFVTNIYFSLSGSDVSREKRKRLERHFSFVLRSARVDEGNTLLINRGDSEFSAESDTYGVRKGGWGWAAVHTDFDNDANRDLFHTTKTLIRIDEDNPVYTYPMLWQLTGEAFEKHNASALGFAETSGRGAASLDYDRDGDVDLIVSTYNNDFRVYENTADSLDNRNSLRVRVVEENGRTTAVGAKVAVTVNGTTQFAVQNTKADYQSQDSRVLHFGLAETERVDSVAVTWPDGTERTIDDVRANRSIVVRPNGSVQAVTGTGGS